ncbi:MAG TPA: U32 family peptidase [Povalibacter sp.]|uniref:ubiquinone anaerobic biosynthesis protein UbiV n=1 Tax=Povalibacter sp. TaxID=1962978 RepID=UPI002CE87271|nr:U32 family peptidase [Povalibacter sp.]HMN46374.1 U32 family peptidase [Povalibacter sp.]
MNVKLAVGPLLYLWDRASALHFYAELCQSPVDIVYLGEVVCSKRRTLQREDWPAVAQMLRDAGKEVVASTLALIEAESEVATACRIAEENALVEANDYAVVHALAGRAFVAGPHLNVYNAATLTWLARHGARRWVAPLELPLGTIGTLSASRPANMEFELFAYGRMPLAFSARCFTARAHRLQKDECGFVCGQYPDGLTLYSREARPFLAFNGIQTQSAAIQNLLPHVNAIRDAGVDILRLSPHSHDFLQIVQTFRDVLDGARLSLPESFLPGGYCDGYPAGAPGIAHAGHALPN